MDVYADEVIELIRDRDAEMRRTALNRTAR